MYMLKKWEKRYVHYPQMFLAELWQALYQDIWDIGSSRSFFTE